jgi:hypothetical protein
MRSLRLSLRLAKDHMRLSQMSREYRAMTGNVVITLSLPVVRLYSPRRAFVYSAADLPLNGYKQYMSMSWQHHQAQGLRSKCISKPDISLYLVNDTRSLETGISCEYQRSMLGPFEPCMILDIQSWSAINEHVYFLGTQRDVCSRTVS